MLRASESGSDELTRGCHLLQQWVLLSSNNTLPIIIPNWEKKIFNRHEKLDTGGHTNKDMVNKKADRTPSHYVYCFFCVRLSWNMDLYKHVRCQILFWSLIFYQCYRYHLIPENIVVFIVIINSIIIPEGGWGIMLYSFISYVNCLHVGNFFIIHSCPYSSITK